MNTVDFTEEIQIKLLEWLNVTEAFVLEQAPDIAQQVIAWGVAFSHIEIFIGWLCLGLVGVCIPIFCLGCRQTIRCPADNEWKGIIAIILSVLMMLIGGISCPLNLYSGYVRLIKIDTASKVYLIDEISRRW